MPMGVPWGFSLPSGPGGAAQRRGGKGGGPQAWDSRRARPAEGPQHQVAGGDGESEGAGWAGGLSHRLEPGQDGGGGEGGGQHHTGPSERAGGGEPQGQGEGEEQPRSLLQTSTNLP